MQDDSIRILSGSTQADRDRESGLVGRLRNSPIPDRELLGNLGLYVTRQTLSRIQFIQHLYALIVPTHGVIMEFGVRWGQNMALFTSLRGIHEPFNYNRRVIGFDTFAGFPAVSGEDGDAVKPGDYGVASNWMAELDDILQLHNDASPIAHKRKHELVCGDASVTLPRYLSEHPETVIALAYFDFDIYKPTRDCLQAIQPFLTKGSVLAFDELNVAEFPGETLAVREVLGLSTFAIRRVPASPLTSYVVIE